MDPAKKDSIGARVDAIYEKANAFPGIGNPAPDQKIIPLDLSGHKLIQKHFCPERLETENDICQFYSNDPFRLAHAVLKLSKAHKEMISILEKV